MGQLHLADMTQYLNRTELDAEELAGRGWRRYSPRIEQLYQAQVMSQSRAVIICWLVGIVLYDSFIASDYFVAHEYFLLYAVARIGIMTPACLMALLWASRSKTYYEVAINLVPLFMSITLSVLLLLSRGPFRTNYLFGDILLIMCATVVSRVRLPYAIITVILQTICFLVVAFCSTVISPDDRLVSVLFCVSGAAMALLTSYMLERDSRRIFMLGLKAQLLNRELQLLATTDPLTGLGNRRRFGNEAERFWAACEGSHRPVTIIIIDIDRFKLFNDSYGHVAGDQCLTAIAQEISLQVSRIGDLAFRFGGEEFVVFLPDTSFDGGWHMAESIRLAIGRASIPHPALHDGAVVSASFGVASSSTADKTASELIQRADIALYQAKQAGRNRVFPLLRPLAAAQAEAARPNETSEFDSQRDKDEAELLGFPCETGSRHGPAAGCDVFGARSTDSEQNGEK